MATVTSAPDHWEGEDVIITIEEEGKDIVLNFEGTVLKINKSGGEESTTDVHAFGGKTFNYGSPRAKVTLAMDVVIKNADWDRVHWGNTGNATALMTTEQTSAKVALRKRVILWFCPKANQFKNGTVVIPPRAGPIYRRIYVDCKSVTFDWEFDSTEYKKGTITLEFSSVDSDGLPNEIAQWTPSNSTTALATLLQTTHRGTLTYNTTTPAWTGSYRT